MALVLGLGPFMVAIGDLRSVPSFVRNVGKMTEEQIQKVLEACDNDIRKLAIAYIRASQRAKTAELKVIELKLKRLMDL